MTKFLKRIFSVIFIFILMLQYMIFISDNNKTVTVFSEATNYSTNYSDYLIELNGSLSTKNFNEFLNILNTNEEQIKKIYPYYNRTWNKNIKNDLTQYSYDNLNNFIEYYKNQLKQNNLDEEISNIDIYGIKIEKVLIYTTEHNIEKLKQAYPIIEYKKN